MGRGIVIPRAIPNRGAVNRDIEHMSLPIANTDGNPGRLRGQVASCAVGARRVQELCARFGAGVFATTADELMNRVAGRLRAALRVLPDGTHEAEALLDHDNVNLNRSIRIHLAVTKTADRILFDFSGSGAQAQGAVNLVPPMVKNSCYCALMAMTDAQLPFNHGLVEVVETRFREGRLSVPNQAPRFPTTRRWRIWLRHGGESPRRNLPGGAAASSAAVVPSGDGHAPFVGKSWVVCVMELYTAQGATNGRDGAI